MHKMNKTVALLAAVALLGCSNDKPAPVPVAQQMTQQCGQSMQTGKMECILVPAGQPNPYAMQQQPAPQPQAQSSGMGVGTVAGAAALGAAAGYLAGQSKKQTEYYNNTQYDNRRPVAIQPQPRTVYTPRPVTPAYAPAKPTNFVATARPKPPAAPTYAPAKTTFVAKSRPATTFKPRPSAPARKVSLRK